MCHLAFILAIVSSLDRSASSAACFISRSSTADVRKIRKSINLCDCVPAKYNKKDLNPEP